MTVNFERRSLLSRIVRRFQGFDGLLAFAIIVLGCAGLITMYSSGHDHGNQFSNHGRNMLIAGACLFFVAQIPPQRLMRLAVPLYLFGVTLLIGSEIVFAAASPLAQVRMPFLAVYSVPAVAVAFAVA